MTQKIELTESQKCMKREVKRDIQKFEDEVTKEIIEGTWSTRKVEKALVEGFKVMNKLENGEGMLRHGKKRVLEIATEYCRKLYSKQHPQSSPRSEVDTLGKAEIGKYKNNPLYRPWDLEERSEVRVVVHRFLPKL